MLPAMLTDPQQSWFVNRVELGSLIPAVVTVVAFVISGFLAWSHIRHKVVEFDAWKNKHGSDADGRDSMIAEMKICNTKIEVMQEGVLKRMDSFEDWIRRHETWAESRMEHINRMGEIAAQLTEIVKGQDRRLVLLEEQMIRRAN